MKTRRVTKSDNMLSSDSRGSTPTQRAEDPLKSFLRQKFRARCIERAAKAREQQIKRRRHSGGSFSSDASSDGYDEAMDEDDEEDDEWVMRDELFRRIMESSQRKKQHAYRVSYALEVGSSFDPDMEDVATWEEELRACPAASTSASNEARSSDENMPPPPDLEEEEVAVYAEELSALAEFDDIPEEDLFSWSDFEDVADAPVSSSSQQGDAHSEDVNMSMS
ncbi:hypothetical protein AX17_006070 [Amanita inopinata Kibby_2008]|nr:hypothetical protein AX17_006070 [Amanita inopinata Kibby_2008]